MECCAPPTSVPHSPDVFVPWFQFVIAPLGILIVVAIVRAVVQTYNKRMTEQHDAASLAEFFFDQDVNPRTHVPARKGWTTVVDETLNQLKEGQAEQKELLENVHTTVKNFGQQIIDNQEQ
jgi:flagellar biosynthesis/type III secretory pathway M-ring protein FliF/YscJ